jgi:hypothetical protein
MDGVWMFWTGNPAFDMYEPEPVATLDDALTAFKLLGSDASTKEPTAWVWLDDRWMTDSNADPDYIIRQNDVGGVTVESFTPLTH